MKKRFVVLVSVLAGLVCQPLAKCSGSEESFEPTSATGTPVNRVLNLDGQTSGVQVPDSESLHSLKDAVTIEAWFKASSFYPDDGNVNSIVRKNVAANEENFHLRLRTVRGKPLVEMSPGCDIGVLLAPYDFAKDKWYHLAGTYDGNVVAVYVNGVRIKSGEFAGRMNVDKSNWSSARATRSSATASTSTATLTKSASGRWHARRRRSRPR